MGSARQLAVLAVASALLLGAAAPALADSSDHFQGPQKRVAQAVESFQSTARKHDAKKICSELLTPALVQRIRTASKRACDKVLKDALTDTDAFDLDVKKVTISGRRATAVVWSTAGDKRRTDTVMLERFGDAWRIASLGPVGPERNR